MIQVTIHRGCENLNEILNIRRIVFIEEQNVDESLEMDKLDDICIHLSLKNEKEVFACSRVIEKNGDFYIGRVAVLKDYRGLGFGKMIVLETEKFLKDYIEKEIKEVFLNAQVQVIDFYKSLGYVEISDFFLEAGIQHKKMKKILI